jgi:hypothetical protein
MRLVRLRPPPRSGVPAYSGRDYLGECGAAVLAARIRNYWSERGVVVQVWIDAADMNGVWSVRSTLTGTER